MRVLDKASGRRCTEEALPSAGFGFGMGSSKILGGPIAFLSRIIT